MGNIPDVVVDGDSRLLVEPDDPGAMAAAVERPRASPACRVSWLRAGARVSSSTSTSRGRTSACARSSRGWYARRGGDASLAADSALLAQ